ncbi:MAG: 5-formyltetrahydrofolate cyclo-ligase [Verrucomicrobiales bacterium]
MMHEFTDDDFGPTEYKEIRNWRRGERKRLIAERLTISAATRRSYTEEIAAGLDILIGGMAGLTCSVYWPYRGEPDLRCWMESVRARGGTCALPCVVQRHFPLVFRVWKPGVRMERGIWNIPVPAPGSEVTPDIIIAPVVGFDRAGYRLGYGGGYFDRTLAALPTKARAIGVGFSLAEVPTIFPQHFDVPMDAIVTEKGIIHGG